MTRETGLLDTGIKELKPPEAPVTVASIQRLQAIFGSEAIVLVRFDNDGFVDRATFRRKAVADSSLEFMGEITRWLSLVRGWRA